MSSLRRIQRRTRRAFTLLEVLVASSILGLGLTVILSSQAGLFASSQRVEHLTQSSNLLRCKMSEVELELLQLGFPLVEKTERGSCCGDEPTAPYACEWTIQTVELPQPASFGQTPGDPSSSSSSSGTTSGLGMDMSQMGQLTSALSGIGTDGKPASLSDVTSAMSQAMPDGGGGLLQMAVGIVYPTLKPMLEASIRKVTVHVRWREGSRDQVLTAVQYVTNPMEGGLNPNAANAMNALMGMDGGTGMPGMSGTQPGASGVQGSGPASPTPGGGR